MESVEELKSKFSNIYIMLLFAVMTNNLDKVKHFLSNKVLKTYEDVIRKNISNNEVQMYDELNVKSIDIISMEETIDYYLVKVRIISRYMDYIVDNAGKYKRGINDRRIEKENYLIFRKNKRAEDRGPVVKCLYCGANLDINFYGVCEYCGMKMDVTSYDYILEDIVVK